ncbi:unnamed protein product [Paramecium pentaurelia]|uniref:Peptidase S49 domain-containing protein n=1 Tax=Paramecium pentaurelia TaxID=43138 RepID=A0A8S1WSH6_9CILI|nr:unnamed protein product [Paramecium pentaurelia]
MSTMLYNSVRFMLKPWRPKREIFHFVFSKAMTQSSATKIIFQLRKHIQEKPKVLMLSINSAYGDLTQAQIVAEAFQQAASNLDAPFYTFIDCYALGSAYYLASCGTEVYANPFSLIGEVQPCKRSIGFQNVLQNLKINYRQSKRESILLDAFTKVSEKQLEFVNKELKTEFQFALDQIKQNRVGKIKKFDESHIYTAQQALENGLIDDISTFDEVLAKKYPKYKFRELTLFKDDNSMIIVQGQLHLAIENLLTKFENNCQLFVNENVYHDIQEQISELLSNALNNIDIQQSAYDLMMDYLNDFIINSNKY